MKTAMPGRLTRRAASLNKSPLILWARTNGFHGLAGRYLALLTRRRRETAELHGGSSERTLSGPVMTAAIAVIDGTSGRFDH